MRIHLRPKFIQLLSVLILAAAPLVLAETPAERAAKAGELVTVKKHRVLRLFGNDIKERGFAHGYLLAEDIRDDADSALNSLPNFSARQYESSLLPWAIEKFAWDKDAVVEMDGIFEGMQARLGKDGLESKILGRALKRDDLYAINTIADYFGPACSGFSAYGERTQNGEVVQGRTLDFPIGAKAVSDQILIAAEALPARGKDQPARKAWVAVGWPGLIGEYTGMNSDGLIVCLHDAYNRNRGGKEGGYVSRGVLLRRMIETVDPASSDAAKQTAQMAGEKPVACGNLFHITWPKAAAEKTSTTPSAVLEFDPLDRKVSVRRMDDSAFMVLTNHFRVRKDAVECDRFKNITSTADLFAQAGKKIGLIEARKLLMSAEQPVAAHSVYFYPDKLGMEVSLTRNNVMSPRVAPTGFTFKELFRQP
jgi:hypothetical protein